MERKRSPALGRFRGKFSVFIGTVELCYIISILYVLYINQSECNQPIRFWLRVLLISILTHFSIFLLAELIFPHYKPVCTGAFAVLSALTNIVLSLFVSVWIIMGSYWFFQTDELCSVTFPEGYLTTYTILIIYYSFLSVGCCLGCIMWILTLIGGGITSEVSYY